MTNVKVGLLGAGYIIKSHAKALLGTPGVTLAAVCDLSRGRAEAAAAEFAIPQVFDTLEGLLASDVDAVHVLLPPALHLDAARRLIDAGKHVFLEKPMGIDAAAVSGARRPCGGARTAARRQPQFPVRARL